MADVFSKRKRSQVMAAIRSKGNKDTELKLVSMLRAYRITGWRRNRPLPGKPDFIFPKHRVAIFVDGCFWHGCPKHGRKPESNQNYWVAKLERNKNRDAAVNALLRNRGWIVLRLWEHELILKAMATKRIKSALRKRLGMVELREDESYGD
jgi:DNA mismatch endonuclease (patch repair protein)